MLSFAYHMEIGDVSESADQWLAINASIFSRNPIFASVVKLSRGKNPSIHLVFKT